VTLGEWLCLSGPPICPAHRGDHCICLGRYTGFLSGPSPQEPGLFECDVVTAQLRYSGLLETVRIRKEGFPVRLPFQVFIDRYLGLVLPEFCRPLPRPPWPQEFTTQAE